MTIDNHFLELNLTNEQLDFSVLQGQIANRGLWVLVPQTTHPRTISQSKT